MFKKLIFSICILLASNVYSSQLEVFTLKQLNDEKYNLLLLSAEKNNPEALEKLALDYFFGVNQPVNLDKSFELCKKIEIKNNSVCLTIVGWYGINYEGENEKKAISQLNRALNLGSAYAFGYLVDHYRYYEEHENAMKLFDSLLAKKDKIAALYFWYNENFLKNNKNYNDRKKIAMKILNNNRDDDYIKFTLDTMEFFEDSTGGFEAREKNIKIHMNYAQNSNDTLAKYTARRELNAYHFTSVRNTYEYILWELNIFAHGKLPYFNYNNKFFSEDLTLPRELELRLIDFFSKLPGYDYGLQERADAHEEGVSWHAKRSKLLSLKDLIKKIEKYIVKKKNLAGDFDPQDLADAGDAYRYGLEGKIDNFTAQYFYEEAIKVAKKLRRFDLEDDYKLQLASLLLSAVNSNVKNNRLAKLLLEQSMRSEYGLYPALEHHFFFSKIFSRHEQKIYNLQYNLDWGIDYVGMKVTLPQNYYELNIKKKLEILEREYVILKKQKSILLHDLTLAISNLCLANLNELDSDTVLHWVQKAKISSDKYGDGSVSDQLFYEQKRRISLIKNKKVVKEAPQYFSVEKHFNRFMFSRNTRQESLPIENILDKKNKVALVIGNANYEDNPLETPENDAEEVAQKLTAIGFEVTLKFDLTKNQFQQTLINFFKKNKNPEISVFYFAGHGMQITGQNFLLPVDLDLEGADETVLFEGIDLNNIVRKFIPGKIRLIFLDACRDNPFGSSFSGGVGKGLASMNAPRNTLISFAARDGGIALDKTDKTKNSPYTASLLQNLSANEDISIILRKIREEVLTKTNGMQEPWEYGSLPARKIILSVN